MPDHHFTNVYLVALTMIMSLSSCDKPKKLDAERARLTAERQLILDEIESYDNKTKALGHLGAYGSVSNTDRNADALLKQAEASEKVANEKLSKWSGIEARFNALREKTTEYKTKNLR